MRTTKRLKSSILVPSISISLGIFAYLILSGTLFSGFTPLNHIVETTSYGSFSYVTNIFNYETSEVSYNMEDMYNSTHLYDFSGNGHLGKREGSLQPENGFFGQSLQWQSGQIIGENLSIIDTSFTIEAWIYPTNPGKLSLAAAFETDYPHIIWRADNGSMAYQYTGGTEPPPFLYSNRMVELNVWTHVALVYDFSSSTARWYVNGSEQGSKQVLGGRDWDGRWIIGRTKPDVTAFEWKGRIDEFRIHKGKALTESEIQEDMRTSLAHKLTLYGLTPNSDVAKLSYPNGGFSQAHPLEQTADANGQVEFNVYSFSGRSADYNGILEVLRSGRTYTSPLIEFLWEDVYFFSTRPILTEMQIAIFVAVALAIVPPVLMMTRRYIDQRRKLSGTTKDVN